ncbi:hypothetical protein ATS72_017305 [Pseudoalteromonas sp. 13-15]|uniref:hypothetical protein n=1 Tax=Pseudoalteromonas TaxID=53246 RepID=UPI000731D63E|nr:MULTISPECIES: hypothetical protein [Pseudoalteromonas]AUL75382.1 hypothetical protein ATS72_017305 [Pseudoalteromonas sp. 13-15]WFO20821.1 hypothetical protein ATS73_018950 [Pseudoalteromonas sp. H100]SIO23855.1 hypothetical protein SAMN05878071_3475 [Pseudoalteromonas marina]
MDKNLALKYQSYIEDVAPNVITILRSHLVIEEQLNQILEIIAFDYSSLCKAKLSFSQLVRIVQAFLDDPCHPNLFPSIINLNKLRNMIAHNLEPSDLDKQLTKFITSASNGIEKDIELKEDESINLEFCLGLIMGQLSATIESIKP